MKLSKMVVRFVALVLTFTGCINAGRLVYTNGTVILEDEDVALESLDIESHIIGSFKIWHIGGMVLVFIMAIIITLCCCQEVRIPRTKQEIESNNTMRKLNSKFETRLFSINNIRYRKYIEDMLSNNMERKTTNNVRANSKTKRDIAYDRKIGDNSQKILVSKWKSVAMSLKTIQEEIPTDRNMITGEKNNAGYYQQRPSQENIAKTLNSLCTPSINHLSGNVFISNAMKEERSYSK